MTLDGFWDHTAENPGWGDNHHYATELLNNAGGDSVRQNNIPAYAILAKPSKKKPFWWKSWTTLLLPIDKIPKIVFQIPLKTQHGKVQSYQTEPLTKLFRTQTTIGEDIFIGSRSIIIQLMNLNLIDEYQFMVHPVRRWKWFALVWNITGRTILKLIKAKHLVVVP